MRRPLTRIAPAGPPSAYQTFRATAPIQTHWRPATCAEVECVPHVKGWTTRVDETTDLGAQQAGYIRHHSGRRYNESRDNTGLVVFTFEAGQTCFNADTHTVPLERNPIYTKYAGDYRAPGAVHRYDRADQWVDDFASHQNQLADRK